MIEDVKLTVVVIRNLDDTCFVTAWKYKYPTLFIFKVVPFVESSVSRDCFAQPSQHGRVDGTIGTSFPQATSHLPKSQDRR
jgi:hypothetical protein